MFQLQEDMKKQLNGEVNYTEEELEKYIQSYKRVMVDSLWKLNVANIEATFFHVCQLVCPTLNQSSCFLYANLGSISLFC